MRYQKHVIHAVATPIRRVMQARGLSQKQLAEVLGSSLQRIKFITTGRVGKLKPAEIRALVEQLRVNPVWLTTGVGEMFSAPADGEAAVPVILEDFFMNRLQALGAAGASDEELDREAALGLCMRWLDGTGFTADDLYFILTFIAQFATSHPAALFARLRRTSAEPRTAVAN